MKMPLSWVGLYADSVPSTLFSHDIREVAHMYSIHTAEIDSIDTYTIPDTVVVGEVLHTEPHPNSDHLNIVTVSCGTHGQYTIVCGAANVRTAHYVPVALVGTHLGDMEIRPVKLRGVESHGMICSEDELGLAKEHMEGILPLETVWDTEILARAVGQSLTTLTLSIPSLDGTSYPVPLQDTVLEIDNKFITNRPDLFGIRGNAREFTAIFGGAFRSFDPKRGIDIMGDKQYPLTIQTDKVLSYHAWAFKDIHVSPSVLSGMTLLLRRADIAPKLDIVDMTNYLMTELGQPMHVFDADKLMGGIVVRQARVGETIVALDGRTYTLTPDDMVIADHERPIAIAGIMGGMDSAVSLTTTRIVVESACFDPVAVRLTGQRLGLRTDASTRYEKSLDPLLASETLPRVLDILKHLGLTIIPE